jgi:non-homologous end joining protein Ku
VTATVWKGHLSFGLVSIPVRLYRAARAEKVSFRQLHCPSCRKIKSLLQSHLSQSQFRFVQSSTPVSKQSTRS